MPREPKYLKRRAMWREVLYDLRGGATDSQVASRLQLLETWRTDYWAYLTGRDLDGTPIIRTVDELDEENPVKPFPGLFPDFAYLRPMADELFGPYRIVLIDKSRQVYATTLCCLLIDWFCTFKEEREVFVSRVKEASAVKLINDKIRTVHDHKPKWLQLACPITEEPMNIITYTSTGSTVTGVAQNFAETDARGPTASLTMVDEAAYQDYFPLIYRAILPMTGRLWGITTANIGNPGAQLFKRLSHEQWPNEGKEEEGDILGDQTEE